MDKQSKVLPTSWILKAYQAEKPIIFQIVNLVLKKLFICALAAFYYFEHQGVPVEQALW